MPRRIHRQPLGDRFAFQHPQARELVLHILKRQEDRVPIRRRLRLIRVPRLIRHRMTLPRIEQKLRGLRSKAPQRARTLQPCPAMRALKATRTAQADVGVERADRNPNLRIRRCGPALLRGNIRAALK